MSEYHSYLIHYGTPGQKWGVRRFQNEDGTWTEEGKERRRVDASKLPHYGGKGIQAPLYKAAHPDIGPDKEVKGPNETDYVIKKGSIYKRLTTEENEKFNKRMYVGGGNIDGEDRTGLYLETLEAFYGVGWENVYLDTLETKKDVIIAGKDTVESILKEIGDEDANKIISAFNSKRLNPYFDAPKKPNKQYNLFGGKTKAYKQYEKDYEDFNKKHTEQVNYIDFMYGNKYEKTANEVIRKLKDMGYDGLSDPADGTMLDKEGFDPDATIFINDVLKKIKQQKGNTY